MTGKCEKTTKFELDAKYTAKKPRKQKQEEKTCIKIIGKNEAEIDKDERED